MNFLYTRLFPFRRLIIQPSPKKAPCHLFSTERSQFFFPVTSFFGFQRVRDKCSGLVALVEKLAVASFCYGDKSDTLPSWSEKGNDRSSAGEVKDLCADIIL